MSSLASYLFFFLEHKPAYPLSNFWASLQEAKNPVKGASQPVLHCLQLMVGSLFWRSLLSLGLGLWGFAWLLPLATELLVDQWCKFPHFPLSA